MQLNFAKLVTRSLIGLTSTILPGCRYSGHGKKLVVTWQQSCEPASSNNYSNTDFRSRFWGGEPLARGKSLRDTTVAIWAAAEMVRILFELDSRYYKAKTLNLIQRHQQLSFPKSAQAALSAIGV
jgi:hypothetical protein